MGLLSTLFGLKAKTASTVPAGLPAIAATTAAPVPAGEWSIAVDRHGFPITDRAPAPGDMLARPSVFRLTGQPDDRSYAGTIPVYDPKNYNTEDARVAASIDYQLRSQRNTEFLDRAIFLLSQSDDGRCMLGQMRENGFRFVFDHDRVKNEGAVGLCDYASKLIPLAEGRSAEEVVLTLKHELQHMEDIKNGLSSSHRDTLHARTAADRALEANARVSEAVLASELYLGSPSGPQSQFRTTSVFTALWQAKPEIAAAAAQAIDEARQNRWSAFAAHVMPAYYQMKSTLAYYDQRTIGYLSETAPDIRSSLDWIAQRPDSREAYQARQYINQSKREIAPMLTEDSWTQDRLVKTVTIRGRPYLDASTDYTAPAYTGLTAAAVPAHEKLVAQVALLDEQKTAGLHLPQDNGKPQAFMPNPFTASAARTEPAFAAIVMPVRIDGSTLTNGQRTHAYFSENIAAAMKDMGSGRTETDKLHFVITDFMHRSSSNLRGSMDDLVGAGLLAPIGCFPDEYLQNLYGRMRTDARHETGTAGHNAVMPAELQMIEHWRAIAAKGLDPVWIDKDNKNASIIGNYEDINFWADKIVRAIAPAAQTPPVAAPRLATA